MKYFIKFSKYYFKFKTRKPLSLFLTSDSSLLTPGSLLLALCSLLHTPYSLFLNILLLLKTYSAGAWLWSSSYLFEYSFQTLSGAPTYHQITTNLIYETHPYLCILFWGYTIQSEGVNLKFSSKYSRCIYL